MVLGRDWWDRPSWGRLRRALFQIHLWIGLAAGIYVLFISLTGSIITLPDSIVGDYRKSLTQLHVFLLNPEVGYPINAAGGVLFTALGVTGIVIWWPGIRNWRRSLIPGREATWSRFSWRLHNAAGFWSLLLILMWGITGVFLSLRNPTLALIDSLTGMMGFGSVGETLLKVFGKVHQGDLGVLSVRPLWGVLGIVPPLLLFTGVVMWWSRTRKANRR